MKAQPVITPVTDSPQKDLPVSSSPEGEYTGVQKGFGKKSRILILTGMLVLLCFFGGWASQYLHHQLLPINTQQTHLVITTLIFIYAICMILPYLPAIELGLFLLAMLDIPGILMLYLVTVAALSLSYGIGRMVPVSALRALFQFLHFQKASELICSGSECDEKGQIDRFIEHAPKRFIPFLLNHRYCVFAVVINTPGNMIIGGAGGIALMSGMSRMFGTGKFLVTVLVAVSPLPIIVILSKILFA